MIKEYRRMSGVILSDVMSVRYGGSDYFMDAASRRGERCGVCRRDGAPGILTGDG